jgi:hypothetical protein
MPEGIELLTGALGENPDRFDSEDLTPSSGHHRTQIPTPEAQLQDAHTAPEMHHPKHADEK